MVASPYRCNCPGRRHALGVVLLVVCPRCPPLPPPTDLPVSVTELIEAVAGDRGISVEDATCRSGHGSLFVKGNFFRVSATLLTLLTSDSRSRLPVPAKEGP